MSSKKRTITQKSSLVKKSKNTDENESVELFENENSIDVAILPGGRSSDSDSEDEADDDSDNDDSSSDSDNNDDIEDFDFERKSYHEAQQDYTNKQKKLEPDHVYQWVEGEKVYTEIPINEYLLKDKECKKIAGSSPTELFELFFCKEIKQYIVEASILNGLDLSVEELDKFIAIILLSPFNERTSEKDYWSTNKALECPLVRSLMSRQRYLKIKSKIKCSKPTDENPNDPAWRVRQILNIFNRNIKKFGIFETALSVDEMMIKFFGRLKIKQFIRNKPTRWGIKEWGICGADGYLFHCDIYCGKDHSNDELSNIPLGSQVVLKMCKCLFLSTSRKSIEKYHLTTDNYFTNPDLLVHLMKLGLRATGVVRKDRINIKNVMEKNAVRGTYKVQHDKNSGINFITLIDSKEVSLISTAAGVTPMKPAKRYSKEKRMRTELFRPHAFKIYNSFMGGVDCHDQYCSALLPSIRSKRWTWPILMRVIQSSVANAVILYNACSKGKRKMSAKKFALAIVDDYVKKAALGNLKNHVQELTITRKVCAGTGCATRTFYTCKKCQKHYCSKCFQKVHS